MTRRSLPERTIDAWISAAVVAIFPNALIWAPTQSKPDNWDLAAEFGTGKTFILENKGCEPRGNSHVITVSGLQLNNYCAVVEPRRRVFYVLPDPPWTGLPTGSAFVPNEATHRLISDRWMWVAPAPQLQRYLGGVPVLHRIDSAVLAGLPFTETFGDFLAAIRTCQRQETLVKGSNRLTDLTRLSSVRGFTGSALAVFIPESDLAS